MTLRGKSEPFWEVVVSRGPSWGGVIAIVQAPDEPAARELVLAHPDVKGETVAWCRAIDVECNHGCIYLFIG